MVQSSLAQSTVFGYSGEHKYDVVVSEAMSAYLTSKFRLLKPNVSEVTYPQQPLYQDQLSINPAKLADLRKLAKYLTQPAEAFIAQLTDSNARDGDELDFGEEED